MKAIVDEFNSTNEWGIKVTEENQGGYSDIFNKMLPILNSPDVPALVVAYQNQAATYQLSKSLADLNPLVNSAKWGLPEADQKDIFPGFFAQDVFPNFDNARLGWPGYRSEEVLYYNPEWLKELGYDAPPTTPEQFKEMACKAAQTPYTKTSVKIQSPLVMNSTRRMPLTSRPGPSPLAAISTTARRVNSPTTATPL